MLKIVVKEGIVWANCQGKNGVVLGNIFNRVIRVNDQATVGCGVIQGNVKDGFFYVGRSAEAGYGVLVGHLCEGKLYRSGQAVLKSGTLIGNVVDYPIEGDVTDEERIAIWHFLVEKIFK